MTKFRVTARHQVGIGGRLFEPNAIAEVTKADAEPLVEAGLLSEISQPKKKAAPKSDGDDAAKTDNKENKS